MYPGKLCLALAAITLGLASPALADTINVTSSALQTVTLSPSNDTFNFDAGNVTATTPGTITLQSGIFYLGDSPIPDQVISFSFDDTITLNGITNTVTIFGSDNVTSSADIFTIFASNPVNFGDYNLTIDTISYSGTSVGQNTPINLTADVSATPEPGTFVLLGTGIAGGLIIVRRQRSLLAF